MLVHISIPHANTLALNAQDEDIILLSAVSKLFMLRLSLSFQNKGEDDGRPVFISNSVASENPAEMNKK